MTMSATVASTAGGRVKLRACCRRAGDRLARCKLFIIVATGREADASSASRPRGTPVFTANHHVAPVTSKPLVSLHASGRCFLGSFVHVVPVATSAEETPALIDSTDSTDSTLASRVSRGRLGRAQPICPASLLAQWLFIGLPHPDHPAPTRLMVLAARCLALAKHPCAWKVRPVVPYGAVRA